MVWSGQVGSMGYTTVAICGPTASGKTSLSLNIAEELSGEIVNTDSVQVYQDLCIGAAKLPKNERRGIAHHVMDVFPPTHRANVAEFRSIAMQAITDISQRSKIPILVGGSGLYLTALLHGLADMPPKDAAIREMLERMCPQERYEELQRVDPTTARILSPKDTVRVVRALEVYRISGVSQSTWHSEHRFDGGEIKSLVIVPCLPRDVLYERINQRSQRMVADGLVAETQGVISRYGTVGVLDTLGYKQAVAYIEGRLSQESLATEIALMTRRFAKRQMTYWRNEPLKRGWKVRPDSDEGSVELLSTGDTSNVGRANRVKAFNVFKVSMPELIDKIKRRLDVGLSQTEVWYVWIT